MGKCALVTGTITYYQLHGVWLMNALMQKSLHSSSNGMPSKTCVDAENITMKELEGHCVMDVGQTVLWKEI